MWYTVIFQQHPAGIIAISLAFGFVCCVLGWVLARWAFRRWGPEMLPVPPYFVVVTTLLSIVFAFVAVEVWSLNRQAGALARAEVEAFQRIVDVASSAEATSARFAPLSRSYAAEVTEEWEEGHNQSAIAETTDTLADMRSEATSAAVAGAPEVVVEELYRSIDKLSEARRSRLSLARGHGDTYRWSLVLILSVFSHIAVAIVHADRPRSILTALAIFSPALALSIGVMAIHDNPYVGAQAIRMPPFEETLGPD